MIIALQNTLQKHHRVLLGILLVLMIGSFVFAGFLDDRSGPANIKLAHRGINLTDARTTRQARDLAALMTQSPPETFLDEARLAAQRQKQGEAASSQLFYVYVSQVDKLNEADALGIPTPDDATLKDFIRNFPPFTDRTTGKFSPEQFRDFSESARNRLGIDEARLAAALGNFWRISRLDTIKAPEKSPGLDTLATRLAARDLASWTVETAVFERSGYKPAVSRDEAAINAYFEANKERYRIPQKLRLRAAVLTGDLAAAAKLPEPGDDELRQVAGQNQNNPRLVRFTGNSQPELEAYLKSNHSTLVTLWRENKAGEAAAVKLVDGIVGALPTGGARPDDAKIDAALKTLGFPTINKLPAYGSDALPSGTGIPDALLQGALKLSATQWRTSAIPFGANVYLFVFDGAEPSRLPLLAEVRERVLADRDGEEATRLYAEAASAKAAEIAAAVKAGKNFAEAAKAAGLKPSPAATFEFRNPPEALANTLYALEQLPVGSVSGALRQGENRVVAHLVSRVTPTEVKDKALVDKSATRLARDCALATTRTPDAE